MKILKWLLGGGFLVSGIDLFLNIDDPFGIGFWASVYSFLFFTFGVFGWVAMYFIRQRRMGIKLVAIVPITVAAASAFVLVSLIVDYRWLLPGFPKRSLDTREWKADYQSLKKILYRHPAFTDSLDQSIFNDSIHFDQLSEDESLIAFMRLAGKLHDGHTYVHPFQPAIKARYFPLQGYWFDDGYFITKASDRYQHLIGQKVTAINGRSVTELSNTISQLTGSENPWQAKHQFDLYVFSANVLHGLRVIESSDEAIIQTEDQFGERKQTTIKSEPFFTWFFWALKPIEATELSPVKLNLRKSNYYLEVDSVHRLILLPIHAMRNGKDDSFELLADRLNSSIELSKARRIVVDLRNNQGGNNQLYQPLIDVLVKYSNNHTVYVLTSRKTFSAAVNFISELKKKANIILVGEPTGAGHNHYGDAGHQFLPRTHLSFFVSSRKWELDAMDSGRWIKPDITIDYDYKDYERLDDPWLKVVGKNDGK